MEAKPFPQPINKYNNKNFPKENKKIEIQRNFKKPNVTSNVVPNVTVVNQLRQPAFVDETLPYDELHRIGNDELPGNFTVKNLKTQINETSTVSLYAEICFKCKRRRAYRNDYNSPLKLADFVIVEVENGTDIGTVFSTGPQATERIRTHYKNEEPAFTIIRLATEEDLARNKRNLESEEDVLEKTRALTHKYNLDMKVTEAEWQFDCQRLTISFTAPQRIDFRDLVKDLARTFKTRIELRQISTREEAKHIGGLGSCGRPICCSSFSADFNHVTLDHARTQQLSNNVAKLSGYCGRLKCCLLFEYPNYVEAFKKYPPLNAMIEFPDGMARIMKIDIFKDLIYLQVNSSIYRTITFSELEVLKSDGKVIMPQSGEELQICSQLNDEIAFDDEVFEENY
jgi:cell fate regulator YaaT (PSP1 superfamily)